MNPIKRYILSLYQRWFKRTPTVASLFKKRGYKLVFAKKSKATYSTAYVHYNENVIGAIYFTCDTNHIFMAVKFDKIRNEKLIPFTNNQALTWLMEK